MDQKPMTEEELLLRKKKQALAKSFTSRLDQACSRIQDMRIHYD